MVFLAVKQAVQTEDTLSPHHHSWLIPLVKAILVP